MQSSMTRIILPKKLGFNFAFLQNYLQYFLGYWCPTIHNSLACDEKVIKRPWKNLKSYLTEDHMALQVSFAKQFIKDNSMFNNMLCFVHIGEKRFFLIVNRDYYYLTPKEEPPFGFVKHKKHISK